MSESRLRQGRDGLYVSMAGYRKLSAAPQAIYYWEAQNQGTIRACLGDQLPEVKEFEDRGEVRFSKYLPLQGEVCGKSKPLGTRRIPASEIRKLEAGIGELKKKLNEPGLPNNSRKLIEDFRPRRRPSPWRRSPRRARPAGPSCWPCPSG